MPPHIDELLRHLVEIGGSDLHVKALRPPLFRLNSLLETSDRFPEPLTAEDTQALAEQVMSDRARRRYRRTMNGDCSYSIEGLSRFRVNILRQKGHTGIVIRKIPSKIPTLEEMNLPEALKLLTLHRQGLVLVTGPTGSGKSTTLAAMIDYINQGKKHHIITLEDPIEFYHTDKLSAVNQREVGTDTSTFSDALRGALRQDPDVILIGELRDPETIEIALTAAETGHLVFSTLHTNDAPSTIERIANTFPKSARPAVLAQLSVSLVGVVSQQLVRRKDGKGRAAAIEIMVNNPAIAKQIQRGQATEILPIIERSVLADKMQSMNQSLCALWANEVISEDEALSRSSSPDDLRLLYDRCFFIEKYRDVPLDEAPLDPVSKANLAFIQSLPRFPDRLAELAHLRNSRESMEDRGKMTQGELEQRVAKLQQEREEAQALLGDLKQRLDAMKIKVDQTEDGYKQQVARLDADVRQLELRFANHKRRLETAVKNSAETGGRAPRRL